MNNVLTDMLKNYECETDQDYQNALKEVIQEISLLGLWRSKFFEHAAFYGGTALRILYGLERFSEDLDFILLKENLQFKFNTYQSALERELAAFGLSVSVSEKKKTKETAIKSAFLKMNTKELVINIGAPQKVVAAFQQDELIKIKLEIDTSPCSGFSVETKNILSPLPFGIRTLSMPSLFAGKIHAVLCRGWGIRVKGRDWYDMLWFIQRKTPVDLIFLEQKMRETKHYIEPENLSLDILLELLRDKINKLDIELAKDDIRRFIKSPQLLDGWSKEVFLSAIKEIQYR